MNKTEFEYLKDFLECKPLVGWNNLEDLSERTLLWGYTCERDSWHVYIKDGEIHTVIYDYHGFLKHHESYCETERPQDWVPNKRLYPEACDYDFCRLLQKYGCYLPFTTWNDERTAKQYHGKILEELRRP